MKADPEAFPKGLDLRISHRFSMLLYFKCGPFLLIGFLPHSFLDGSKQHFKHKLKIEKTQNSN